MNEWVSYAYVRIEQLVYTLARNAVSSLRTLQENKNHNDTRRATRTQIRPKKPFHLHSRSDPPTISFTFLLSNTTKPFSHNHPEGGGADDIFDLFGGKHE